MSDIEMDVLDNDTPIEVEIGEITETGGTSNYNTLTNKPKINGVELVGNKSITDLQLDTAINSSVAAYVESHKAELKGDKGDPGDTYTITSADYDAIADVVLTKLTAAESVSV